MAMFGRLKNRWCGRLRRGGVSLFVCAHLFCGVVVADVPVETVAPAASTESVVAALTAQVGELKAERDALRRENQQLRRELVARRRTGASNPALPQKVVADVPAPAADVAVQPETDHWLSVRSQTRHNARCRNFKKSKGRFCGPQDGKPCKVCGG